MLDDCDTSEESRDFWTPIKYIQYGCPLAQFDTTSFSCLPSSYTAG